MSRAGTGNAGRPVEPLSAFRYDGAMTAKEKVLQAIRSLPRDASIEDAMEKILFLAKVERGLAEAEAGKTIPHEKIRKRMAKWLK